MDLFEPRRPSRETQLHILAPVAGASANECVCLCLFHDYRCTSRPRPWPSPWASARRSPWECSTCPRCTWFCSTRSRTFQSESAAWRRWSPRPPCPTSSTQKAAWGPTGRPSLNCVKASKRKVGMAPEGRKEEQRNKCHQGAGADFMLTHGKSSKRVTWK